MGYYQFNKQNINFSSIKLIISSIVYSIYQTLSYFRPNFAKKDIWQA